MRITKNIEADFVNVSNCLNTSIEYDFLCNRIWRNKIMLRALLVGVLLFVISYILILLNIDDISVMLRTENISKFNLGIISFFISIWGSLFIAVIVANMSLVGREKVQVDDAKVIRAYVINQYERRSNDSSSYYAKLACRDDNRILLDGNDVLITREEFQSANRGIEVIYNVYQYTLNSEKKTLSVSDTEFAKFVKRKYGIL